jgi:hypothetical protein
LVEHLLIQINFESPIIQSRSKANLSLARSSRPSLFFSRSQHILFGFFGFQPTISAMIVDNSNADNLLLLNETLYKI